jgi:hypothetical protein
LRSCLIPKIAPLLPAVLDFLTTEDKLLSAALVCTAWRNCVYDTPSLWRALHSANYSDDAAATLRMSDSIFRLATEQLTAIKCCVPQLKGLLRTASHVKVRSSFIARNLPC